MSVAGRREPLPGFNDVPKLRLFFTCIRPFWPPFFSVVRADCAVGEQGVRDCGFDRGQETFSLSFSASAPDASATDENSVVRRNYTMIMTFNELKITDPILKAIGEKDT